MAEYRPHCFARSGNARKAVLELALFRKQPCELMPSHPREVA